MAGEDKPPRRSADRRERRRASTRQRLQDNALRLALEHGAESVTVGQISDAADIAPRTFFNYFPSKEDALLPAQEARLEELAAALEREPEASAPPAAGAWQALTRWALAGDLCQENARQRIRLALRTRSLAPRYLARYAAIENVLAAYLSDRPDVAGPGSSPVPPMAVAAAIVAVFRAAVQWWALGEDQVARPLPDILAEAYVATFGMPPTRS